MLDILIKNGEVIDGSGAPRFRADLAVQDGRVCQIGQLEDLAARQVIDAAGCVTSPGFVDMHSHADFTLPILPTADSLVHQGITTAVVGQCGASPTPLLTDTREEAIASMQSEDMPLPWEQWSDFGSYVDHLARTGISVNVVPLVGQGTVRIAVMGFSAEPANPTQIARMQAEVNKAMDQGAIGVSTGLIYPPGSYAHTKELVAVTRPAGERGGFYFSHIRGEDQTLLEAITEAIHIGRETGAAVQISHFKAFGRANWAKSAQALELIDQAREEGLDVTTDMYPYLAGATSLSSTLPQWAQQGGKAATLQRLADKKVRRQMALEMQSRPDEWDLVLISRSPNNRDFEGHYVSELASQAGKSPYEWIFDALLETAMDLGMITFGMSEENRQREIQHPAMMIGTDAVALAVQGPLSKGKPHPRSYGAFPRVLGHFVRERGLISLETAIWKMSGLPAQKLRWTNRGLIKENFQADLVVFEPDSVSDRATYQSPHQYPAGIRHVIINGVPVIHNQKHTGVRPGTVLGQS